MCSNENKLKESCRLCRVRKWSSQLADAFFAEGVSASPAMSVFMRFAGDSFSVSSIVSDPESQLVE
jgi:hypothetical protein